MAEYEEVPDRTLLQYITQEKEGALEALYLRYGTSVYSLAMFMLRQPPLAEEVVWTGDIVYTCSGTWWTPRR